MTLPVFFGCACIAFGPALSLFLLTVVAEPLRIIILIAGAFFWLVSLLLSSLVWFIAVKASDPSDEALQKGLLISGVIFSVLLQEAFRFLYYKLLRKAIEGLVALSEDGCSPISIQQMAYAFMTLVLIFLHTFWGVVFFHGCETRHWWEVAVVVLTHLIISGLTFWNPLYLGSLLPAYLLMAAAAVWAYVVSGGSKQNLSRFLLCE
ncbi:gamma-secretase subunit Aph-1b-like isoform X4 [Hemicordylus capensis]|uniref:gamma-secretase subunit Aph-1b-like isoform X4 n=1 Tax=Hemicordylus capensis TaxID=884348 RepID=UPI002302722C|nr:gamma-secretase subunit Aph-1b-like isoform X4 [Hemicordylus capensis]